MWWKNQNPPQLLASWSWFNSFTYGINYLQQSPSKTYDHSCIYSIHIDTNPTNPRRLTLPFNDLCIRDISKQHSQDLYLECEHTLKYRSCFRFLSNLLLFQRIFRCHVIVPPKSNGMWTGLLSSQNKATGWPQKTLFLRFFPALTFLGGRGGKQLVVKPTHLKNMLVKLDDFSRDRDENKKYLSCHHRGRKHFSFSESLHAENHFSFSPVMGSISWHPSIPSSSEASNDPMVEGSLPSGWWRVINEMQKVGKQTWPRYWWIMSCYHHYKPKDPLKEF